ncbi:trimeric intracellular cation channel type B isoform X5 [Bubalus kerabau]|nr:trimeric intracellular cation channel type B isoform X3 [Bubalus bubalis]XP_055435203.1 trimeric intracellular cation channel type B isoform X5 [Bubalus carabanensis]
MESPWNELTLAFSRTSMFPFFDIAHYLVSVMALKHQPGAAALAWKNPLSSWFTAMLHCFGGGILSCVLLAEPPLRFLANNTNILLASSICSLSEQGLCFVDCVPSTTVPGSEQKELETFGEQQGTSSYPENCKQRARIKYISFLSYMKYTTRYIAFFCPCDLISQAYSFLPVQLLAAGMKEVTRTWKIVGGVTHANSYYKNGWIVMIAIGWARGAGGSIITNFEQLVKGCWKPEAEEWLKMS